MSHCCWHGGQRRALRKPPTNLGAWESYQRGRWYLTRFRSEDLPQARKFFDRALELDATLAAAHTALAMVFTREGAMHASRPRCKSLLAGPLKDASPFCGAYGSIRAEHRFSMCAATF
jgi:hypothetical protein